jgi:hypothetical protein
MGLPSSTFPADAEWHASLAERVKRLLNQLESECGLETGKNIGQKLAKKKLTSSPLSQAIAAQAGAPRCKISTVHQVKGESIGAVMYVATDRNVRDLLNGTATENGRIGYVALTRACDLFVLAVREDDIAASRRSSWQRGLPRPRFSASAWVFSNGLQQGRQAVEASLRLVEGKAVLPK